MKTEIFNSLEYIIDLTKNQNAHADVICTTASNLNLKSDKGIIEEYKVSSGQVFGIRVIKDNKVGLSYSESSSQEALSTMIDQAINNSKIVKEEQFAKIEVEINNPLIDESSHNCQEDNSTIEEKIEKSIYLEQKVLQKSKDVKSAPYNSVNESSSSFYLMNTLGTKCFSKDKSFSCYTSALIDKNNNQSMHYDLSIARKFDELDFDKCIDQSFEHANALLDAGPIKTGNYDVIFTPNCLKDLFSIFSSVFSGKAAMENKNALKDKLGQKIAHSGLTIKDLPQFKQAFAVDLFDSEGNMHQETTLVKDGVLNTFYHNSITSKYFKTNNTFNAGRSPKRNLGVTGTNTVIQLGTDPDNKLKECNYFEVLSMQGGHSGADPISGDFSFGASGYLYTNGVNGCPVKGITISGNFFKLLEEIKMIGNKLNTDDTRSFFAPTILFSNLSIGGS